MEGDGEGLVAIVQGLENSGVTLTVCNRSRQNHNRPRPPVQRIQINALNANPDVPPADQRPHAVPAVAAAPARSTMPALQRASVDTSTGSDFSRMATASQICDGRYASSYKLAHCMMSPTSPPEAVTEFPPQRKEPCRNRGNFEIGGQNSAQCTGHGIGHNVSSHGTAPVRFSTSRVRHYGGTQTWGDKCSSHRYSKSNHRDMDAFAHSLRKYPSMAPFRTASTDLIEKLIRYTQAKNFQEVSRSTKSMRSLRHQKSSETYNSVTRTSKHQQTYTRRQEDRVANNSHVQVGYRGRARNFKLYSPRSDGRNHKQNRNRETACSSSYDYLKAGQSNCSDGSRSPTGSGSPERSRSPEEPRSPTRIRSTDRCRSPDMSRSPNRSRSPAGSRIIRPARPSRCDRPLRLDRSMRDLSLSEMSKYIRSTIRQICNERPVVVQVCPKLMDRYNEHKKVCPNKESSVGYFMEYEEKEDPEDQASGSFLSRFIQSFTGCSVRSTEQAGCQCTRPDCYCTKATQCVNNPNAATNTVACHCKNANVSCCRGMPCLCAVKSQDQAYYNKRIEEEISEWLKDVPVHSIEDSESKTKRETIIKDLQKTLKQLPDDENFEANASNEIQSLVNDLPLWNPGKDEKDEKVFKSQLADKLTGKIIALPRKPDRFRDIVKKWVANMDFEDDGEKVDKDVIIENFVNRLKFLAADRPACDVKYTNLLRKEIIKLLVKQALKLTGDMIMLKKMANNLVTEIVCIPRNVILSDETTDLTSQFEENIVDWICEHGLCVELKKDPTLIEGLAKKLNKLKSQGIFDEDIYENMKEEVQQFADDVGLALETIDELIEELMKQLSITAQIKEKERLDPEELIAVVSDWLRNLPGSSDLHPRKIEKIVKELVKQLQESGEQENENLANDIFHYLVDTDLPIDAPDLGIYVEELMEILNILPSDKYYREQAKRVMAKDIYNIIEVSPISENQKEEMRSKANRIIEKNLRRSSNALKLAPDNVKEILLEDMDNAVSEINIPEENQSLMKSRLSTSINKNFDKSFTRLSRNQSDLKQTIAKDVKNAVEELPIDTNKKKDLMQQVKGTLSKNMDKPLPSNVKNNIKEEIADVLKKCSICDDSNVIRRLSKFLTAVASKHLNIWLPKCVCDIKSEVEKDVSIVIDRSSIVTSKKRKLKESIQDILTENEDRRLSDEVIKTIKEDIHGVVSDLSISQFQKDNLKKAVGETVSKDFNEAGKAFRHDLNKIRNKLLDDATNVIEKSPIKRDVKSHLKDKLKTVLARHLDSSLSDEEKHMLLDEVSNIVRADMSEEKRRSLTNKLAKQLDTHQRKDESDGPLDIINRLSLDSGVKDAMKKEVKDMLMETLCNSLTGDVQQNIMEGFLDAIDDMDIPEHDKENLKSNISHAIAEELDKLITQDKEIPEIKAALKNLSRNIIKKSIFFKDKQDLLEKRLQDVLTENFVRPVTDKVKETTRERLEDILDDLIIDKGKADAIKTQLLNVINKDFDKLEQTSLSIESKAILEEEMQTTNSKENKKKTLGNILRDMERAVDEAPMPRDKKHELKKKLKNIAINNFKKPLDNIAEGLKEDIDEILNELNLTKDKKNKLKSELAAPVDRNITGLVGETRYTETKYPDTKRRLRADGKSKRVGKGLMPIVEVDASEVKNSIFQGIENIINASAVPEVKKIELKRKLKKLTAENLKKPFSVDVQDAMKKGIAEIIDDLPVPKSEKNCLINAITDMVDENLDKLQEDLLEDETQKNILQEMERVVAEAPIPRDKKHELKKKLKNIAINNFKKPLDDIAEGLKEDIDEILDELNLPIDKKNKFKSELAAPVDRNITDLLGETRYTEPKYPDTKRKLRADGKSKRVGKGLMPIVEVDASEVKNSIFQGIENIINASAVPEVKKIELKRKLKKLTAENLKQPFSVDVQDAMKKGIAEIIDDLPVPEYEKNCLINAITDMVDENLDKLQEDLLEDETHKNILQEMERVVAEAPIPRDKKHELKKKLKNIAINNFKKPLDDIAEGLKEDIDEILDELNLPIDKKNKFKSELAAPVDRNITDLLGETRYTEPKYPDTKRKLRADGKSKRVGKGLMPIVEVDASEVKNSIFQGIENIINASAVPEVKKIELKRKLKKLTAENLKKPFSVDVQDAMEKGIAEIIDDLPVPESEKNNLKRALKILVDENVPRKTQVQVKEEPLLNIFEEMERAVEEASISKQKKNELKKILQDLATTEFDNKSLNEIESLNDGMIEIINELNLPKDNKNKLKSAITDMIHKKMDIVGEPYELHAHLDHLKEEDLLEDKTQRNILQGFEKIFDEASIPKDKKMELKKKFKDVAAKHFKQLLSDDVLDALKDDINVIIDELNLLKDVKNKLKYALTAVLDENLRNETKLTNAQFSAEQRKKNSYPKHVIDESNLKESMKEEIKKSVQQSRIKSTKKGKLKVELLSMVSGILAGFDEAVDERLKYIFDKYGIKPNYQNTLSEDFDKLLEIALQGEDFEDARRKLIAKLMRDLNLSENEASALTDELIAYARELARNKGVAEILKIQEEELKESDEIMDSYYDVEAKITEAFALQEAPTADEYKEKIMETIKFWMGSIPIDVDPEVAASVAEDLAGDILDRQKYLQAHPEAITSENDEIENLKYQVFRRINNVVDPKDLPMIMEQTETLYRMIMEIEPPAGAQKLYPSSSREKSTSEKRTRDQVQDRKRNTIAALSPGNVKYSLKDLIATNKNVRKQWSRHLDDVIAKLPLLRKEQTDKLPVYDETGQIDLLSTLRRAKEEIDSVASSKPTIKNNIGKLSSWLSKAEEAYALTKTSRNKPRSNSKSKQGTDAKETSQKSSGKTQRKVGSADIRSKATNTTKPDGTPHTAESDAESGLEDDKDPEFSPGQASTPSKERNEQQGATELHYSDRVKESVAVWLDSIPIDLEPDVKTDVINDLVTDIIDRQKYLQAHPGKKFSDDEEIENLRFQVFKRLDKAMEPDSNVSPSLTKMEELYKLINGDARGRKSLSAKQAQEFQTALNEEISAILNEYRICCDKKELLPDLAVELTKLRKSGADQDDIVENLITAIKRHTYLSDDHAEELAYKLLYRTKKLIATIRGDVVKKRDFKEPMMNDGEDVFEGRPMSQAKQRMMEGQLAEGYADDLGIPLQESNVTMSDKGPEPKKQERFGMSFNGLSNFIDSWLSSIHTDDDDEKDENEIMDMKKERMYNLIHKIGEMNVDPEIFNDDSLYEAVLREELQNLLGDVKMNDDEFQALKEDLVEKVLEAQHRAHDEITGQTYKNNLRDTISTLLPDQRNLSKEDQATIETLRDQLADAYIDLHYSGNNENQRDVLKRKISSTINTFCRDYLNRNPCSSLNSRNLNQDLYAALNKVPLPKGDSIKYEVEQARIREAINDWVKELPLQPQSPTELLARNKLIYILSKKLFDMELEGQEELHADNDLMRKEIVKFLNKLPLESEEDNDTIADTLIDKLKASEASRKYNSTSNVTIDTFGNVSSASKKSSTEPPVCPGYKWLLDKRKPCPRKVCGRQGHRRYEFPSCTLSPEECAHLERIRRRTCLPPSCVTSLIRRNECHLGAESPPVDEGSQTMLRPFSREQPQQSSICPSAFEKTPGQCPRLPTNLPNQPCAQGGEPVEMENPQQSSICPGAHEKSLRTCLGASRSSPQSSQQMRRRTISGNNMSNEVQLNKCYGGSSEKNSMDESELQQTGRSCRRQSVSPPSHSPGPGPDYPPGSGPCRPNPCHPPWEGPCHTTRPASRRPAPYNLSGASSCRPAPCQQPRPASCRPAPCHSSRPAPCIPPRPPPCFPPGPLPCDQSRTCFSQPSSAPCRRSSLGRVSPQPKSSRQNSSERYSYCDPHSSIFLRPSHCDILNSRYSCSRFPCSPSPCTSSFGINPQYTPPGSPCFSKRMNECRTPKRDGIQDQPSNSSRPSQKERVIELGSLDDASNARPKKRSNEQSDWQKFHEDDNFWTAPMRRVFLDEGIDHSLVMERERREERVSCRCKERLVPKSGRPVISSNEDGQNLKRCSKCCGIHCPYPSFLYFRQ